MTSTLALALLSLASGADLTVDAGLRVEARATSISPRGGPDERRLEALLVPRLALERTSPSLRVGGAYTPSLRAPDLLEDSELTLVHEAELHATLRPVPTLRLSATAGGTRGETDLLTQSRLSDSGLETITTTRRFQYVAARGELSMEWLVEPRTTLSLATGAFVSGGDGAAARELLPIQRGASVNAGWAWTATPLDELALRASALGTRLEGGTSSAFASVQSSWRRRLTPSSSAWISAGATGTYEELADAAPSRGVLPAAELGFSHAPPPPEPSAGGAAGPAAAARVTPPTRISSETTLTLSSSIDRATGSVDPQLAAALRLHWPATSRWSVSASALAAQVWQEAGRARRGRLESLASCAITPRLRLGMGVHGTWQRASTPTLPSFTEVGVFLSLEAQAPTLLL